ncbi:MAG: MarC family protein [Verrucomicrobia bacterium]|nr:MarC family protein [Verrucomicrobiota bacterium]
MNFLATTILLFLVIDPIGNIPIFLAVLRSVPEERRLFITLRECALGFVILVLFMLFGRVFLHMLNLSETSLGITGGIILFLIAIRMIFPTSEPLFGANAGTEPLLFPLAVPTIAGPSALATVLLLASRDPGGFWIVLAAVAVSMGLSTLILISAGAIAKLVGRRVLIATERLMGLILTAVAVEMLLQGIRNFVLSLR